MVLIVVVHPRAVCLFRSKGDRSVIESAALRIVMTVDSAAFAARRPGKVPLGLRDGWNRKTGWPRVMSACRDDGLGLHLLSLRALRRAGRVRADAAAATAASRSSPIDTSGGTIVHATPEREDGASRSSDQRRGGLGRAAGSAPPRFAGRSRGTPPGNRMDLSRRRLPPGSLVLSGRPNARLQSTGI
jgi:hypothetical protein